MEAVNDNVDAFATSYTHQVAIEAYMGCTYPELGTLKSRDDTRKATWYDGQAITKAAEIIKRGQGMEIVLDQDDKKRSLKWLEWAGCATGVLGALLLALNNRYSGWGFALFLLSNVFWIAFGLRTRTHSLVTMQMAFTATSLIGIYQWLV